MTTSGLIEEQVRVDYERARRKSFLTDLGKLLGKQGSELLSFEQVVQSLGTTNQTYRGAQTVDVDQIVGSVDRYADFDRRFLPNNAATRDRWKSIDRAYYEDAILPSVILYKVGEVYFVKDGNHRISVAKARGIQFVDAEVTEVRSRIPLTADTDPREMLALAEYGRFLEQTDLDHLRPEQNVRFSKLGRYDILLDHIRVHRYFYQIDTGTSLGWPEAVTSWYDNLYCPVAEASRRDHILEDFPGATEADLYLWVMDYSYYLARDEGKKLSPAEAAADYSAAFGKHDGIHALLNLPARISRGAQQVFAITGRLLERAISSAPATYEEGMTMQPLPVFMPEDELEANVERAREVTERHLAVEA